MSLHHVRHHLHIRNAKTPVRAQFDLTKKSKIKKKKIMIKLKTGFFMLAPTCASQPLLRDEIASTSLAHISERGVM